MDERGCKGGRTSDEEAAGEDEEAAGEDESARSGENARVGEERRERARDESRGLNRRGEGGVASARDAR